MNAKRQKRRVSFGQRRRVRTHKRSMIAIGTVLVLMIITLTVSGMSLKAKEQQSIARETKLEEQIKQEKARTAQIEDMEKYADTDAYVEEIAREKLHLVHKNEILFKAKSKIQMISFGRIPKAFSVMATRQMRHACMVAFTDR